MSFTLGVGTLFDYGAKKAEQAWDGSSNFVKGKYDNIKQGVQDVGDYVDRGAMIEGLKEQGLKEGETSQGILDGGARKKLKLAEDSGKLKQDYLDQVGKSYKDEAAAMAAYEASMGGKKGNISQQLDAKRLDDSASVQIDKDKERLKEIGSLEKLQEEQEGKWGDAFAQKLEDIGRLSALTGKKPKGPGIQVSSSALSGAGRLGTGLTLKDILRYRP